MSVLTFLSSGGMASIGGDLPEEERGPCNEVVTKLAERIRERGIAAQVPASELTLARASFLLVAKDRLNYHFVFAEAPGGTRLFYRDLADSGQLDLRTLVHQVRIEVGEVSWAFSLPIGLATSDHDELVDRLAHGYVQTTLARTGRSTSRISETALSAPELGSYLEAFQRDHPAEQRTAFIMMQFSDTRSHDQIVSTLRETLTRHSIGGLRADDREYADDLFANIRTYMHGCDFGVAVFDRIQEDDINPNVSLEVGYMLGLGKPVCLLKERTLRALQSDLVGKLYKQFDVADISGSIPPELEKWLQDKGIIKGAA